MCFSDLLEWNARTSFQLNLHTAFLAIYIYFLHNELNSKILAIGDAVRYVRNTLPLEIETCTFLILPVTTNRNRILSRLNFINGIPYIPPNPHLYWLRYDLSGINFTVQSTAFADSSQLSVIHDKCLCNKCHIFVFNQIT